MSLKGRLFLLDDDELISSMLARSLRHEGYEVLAETNAIEVIKKINEWSPDLVLLDIHLDESVNGLDVLAQIREEGIPCEVVMLTADDSAESAITAMKLGAADYLTKPFNMDEVKIVIKNTLEKRRLKEELEYLRKTHASVMQDNVVGESDVMQRMKRQAEKLASANIKTVLITGESGTGKEVMARYIHKLIHRHRPEEYVPFIAVNCTALPEQLFESELFGHVKGAFTDAKTDKKGMFELADGGTILLDEIGDMHASLQSKLLRVLEDRTVRRLGGKVSIPVDVVVIATTNAELEKAVEAKTFRMDLFYRLNTFHLTIPALRERKDDIPLLAQHLVGQLAQTYAKHSAPQFSDRALAMLSAHQWPGNIRELRNVIERSVVLATSDTIEAEDLFLQVSVPTFVERRKNTRYVLPETGASLEEIEKDLIKQALERADHNQKKAAELLGMSYDSIRYQIKKYDLS